MLTKHVTVRVFRPWGWIVLAGSLVLAGCGTPFVPTGGGPYATEQAVAHGFDSNESDHRQEKQELSAIKDAMDSNAEKMLNLVDDLNKQLRAQQQDIDKMKSDLALIASRYTSGVAPAATPSPLTQPTPPPLPANPTFAQALQYGKVLFDQNNLDGATAAFRTALGLAADKEAKTQANYWLGEVAFKQKDYNAAVQFYKAAINDNAESAQAWISFERMADIDRERGDNASALQKYNTILTEHSRYNKKYDREAEVKAKIAEIQSGAGPAPAPAPAGGGAAAPAPGGAAPAGPGEFGQPQPGQPQP